MDEMEEGYNNKEDGIHGDAIDGCNRYIYIYNVNNNFHFEFFILFFHLVFWLFFCSDR